MRMYLYPLVFLLVAIIYIVQTKHENKINIRVIYTRLGPAGFWGTDAPCNTVVTGVASCNFAFAISNFCDAVAKV